MATDTDGMKCAGVKKSFLALLQEIARELLCARRVFGTYLKYICRLSKQKLDSQFIASLNPLAENPSAPTPAAAATAAAVIMPASGH